MFRGRNYIHISSFNYTTSHQHTQNSADTIVAKISFSPSTVNISSTKIYLFYFLNDKQMIKTYKQSITLNPHFPMKILNSPTQMNTKIETSRPAKPPSNVNQNKNAKKNQSSRHLRLLQQNPCSQLPYHKTQKTTLKIHQKSRQ